MTADDVFDYYAKEFLPAYARAVAEMQDKPVQISVEIENAFSHLSVSSIYRRDGNFDEELVHIKKAKGHIERATLDAYKFIWIALCKKSKIFDKPGILEFATKVEISHAIALHEQFKKIATEARIKELSNLEEDVSVRNGFYKAAMKAADDLLDCLEPEKLRRYKHFSLKNIIKSNGISFVFGVIAGVTGNFLTNLIIELNKKP